MPRIARVMMLLSSPELACPLFVAPHVIVLRARVPHSSQMECCATSYAGSVLKMNVGGPALSVQSLVAVSVLRATLLLPHLRPLLQRHH
jgi:hypothetical protein